MGPRKQFFFIFIQSGPHKAFYFREVLQSNCSSFCLLSVPQKSILLYLSSRGGLTMQFFFTGPLELAPESNSYSLFLQKGPHKEIPFNFSFRRISTGTTGEFSIVCLGILEAVPRNQVLIFVWSKPQRALLLQYFREGPTVILEWPPSNNSSSCPLEGASQCYSCRVGHREQFFFIFPLAL